MIPTLLLLYAGDRFIAFSALVMAVGGWLYKVAYRIALRARSAAPFRPLPEGPLPDPSNAEPIHDLAWREFDSAMDEEIHRLPERYRLAFVLCHLEGQTLESAARTLDCPLGTVGTWLARGREVILTSAIATNMSLECVRLCGVQE